MIPQVIHFGNESYLEGVDINNETFLHKLKMSAELPKTSAPPPEMFVKMFSNLTAEAQTILCIHPSAVVSGTVRSATIAAAEFPQADIRVLDTRLVASPIAVLVQLATQWIKDGLDADTIESRIRQLAVSAQIYFLVSTLDYLAKGGRISSAQALLGSFLQLSRSSPLPTVE